MFASISSVKLLYFVVTLVLVEEMKNLRIYILLLIYTLSCIGIMVDFHYCGGELVSINLYQADEDECCGEEQEETSDCCDDKYIAINTDDSENFKSFTFQTFNFYQLIAPAYHATKIIDYSVFADKNIIPINHAPPNSYLDQLFIKNRILRI